MISSKKKALEIIKLLETKTSIYNLEVDGIKVWWFIRVYFWLSLANSLNETASVNTSSYSIEIPKSPPKFHLTAIFVFLIRCVKGFLLGFNLRKTHSEVVFLVEDYSLRLNNGYGIQNHVFFSAIYPYFKDNSKVVEVFTEKSLNFGSLRDKKGIIFADYAYLLSLFRILAYVVKKKKMQGFEKFVEELGAIELDNGTKSWILKTIKKLIEIYAIKIILQIESSKIILNKIRPKVIVETVSYNGGIMAFNYVAKQQKAKIVELQHGVITESHIGYKYFIPPNYSGIIPLPNKLLLFGEEFKKAILYEGNGFSDKNLVVVGFPRLGMLLFKSELEKSRIVDQVRTKLKIGKQDLLVLITDQTLYNFILYKFLSDVITLIPEDIILCIKLHPFTEKENCIYNQLKYNRNIRIVDDKFEDLYNLLLSSDVHSTISSTVALEAMAIGKPNIILKLPGYESIVELVSEGDILCASTSEQFIDLLIKIKKDDEFRKSLILKNRELSRKFFLTEEKPEDLAIKEIDELLHF